MTRTSSFFSYTFLTNQRHLKSQQFLPLQLISNISKQNKNKKGTKSTRNTRRYRDIESNPNKISRVRGISVGIGERLPVLGQHPTTGVRDFHSIVRDLVVGSSDHQPNHRFGLQRPQSRQYPNSVHRGFQNRRVRSEPSSAIGELHS